MMSWIELHKLAEVIFRITQKPLYIMLSNFTIKYITSKEIFWSQFVTWIPNGHLFQAPFVYDKFFH